MRDLYDTALSLTTQSKLTVQAPSLGSGVHPTPESIPFGIAASAILSTGDYRAKSAIRWPEDTVFARISLLAGWPSVPEAREDTVFARISLLADTSSHVLTFLQDGEKGPWRIGGSARPCALPRIWGRSLERKFASLLT